MDFGGEHARVQMLATVFGVGLHWQCGSFFFAVFDGHISFLLDPELQCIGP